MITTLMFHRVYADGLPALEQFERFLQNIKQWGMPCLPGQPIASGAHSVCLTFDDAYVDFFYHVFPLLKRYQIPAVLAIPTALIPRQVDMSASQRLALQYKRPLDNQITDNPCLCSWEEIKEMVDSGWVVPASHGATHVVLDEQSDWQKEIIQPKEQLEQVLNTPVSIFVYPHGQFDKATHAFVCQHYRYAMRIGSAANFNWQHPQQLIYRINADSYWPYNRHPFRLSQKVVFGVKALSNVVRGR